MKKKSVLELDDLAINLHALGTGLIHFASKFGESLDENGNIDSQNVETLMEIYSQSVMDIYNNLLEVYAKGRKK